jgi:hypothetical protein
MTTKAELHELVDALPDRATDEAALQLRALAVPLDDEPETDEERAAVAEARAALERGEGLSWDHVRDELIAELPPQERAIALHELGRG